MQHDASGPVPPQPIRPVLPTPPQRRKASPADRRMVTVHKAVLQQGVAYNPLALAEETGLPVDAILRFAAVMVVHENMVELGMIDHEDATRMGSQALAASLRILDKRHDNIEPKQSGRVLRTADVMGMRRMVGHAVQAKRLVTKPQTLCSRCGGRADAQGGCTHQQLMRADETTSQGLPPHA